LIRLHVGPTSSGLPFEAGAEQELPPVAARHLQVLRVQPGERIECFDGQGSAWWAEVSAMRRNGVTVRWLEAAAPVGNEWPVAVTLAVGMPANDRMDSLVEKAVELGVAALQPLVCERSVLRLAGDRAARKVAHWQAVAAAASEQCGRRVVPPVHPVQPLTGWLASLAVSAPDTAHARCVLSLVRRPERGSAAGALAAMTRATVLSGPEGGLSPDEETLARRLGFEPVWLGPRVLRADTAPLAWLARFGARFDT
jgi:16S rRNA (uracil1498-N3)-methyltransferase